MQRAKVATPLKERLVHALLIPCCAHLLASGAIAGLALGHMAKKMQDGRIGDMFGVAVIVVSTLHSVLLLLCVVTNGIIVMRARSNLSRMRQRALVVALLFLIPTVILFF